MLELAAIIVLGIIAQWLAWRMRVPAILPLILIGLLVGPISTLWSADGLKWIEPRFNGEHGFFPGDSLFWFVSLAIGVILFEGGLTLKRRELRGVGSVILRLITVGSAITFVGGGLLAHYLIGLPWPISFLFSALIIVTGPTVIAPILRNVPLNPNVSTVLKWEGILIDPIGALVAVLVFEFIYTGSVLQGYTGHALLEFGKILVIGLVLGGGAGYMLYKFIQWEWIPHFLLNVFTLALVLAVFAISDLFAEESGLLTVVVMGMTLGNLDVPKIREILHFKESLSVLLISVLFILLAANINLSDLELLRNWQSLALFLIIVLVLRPLGVLFSSIFSGMKMTEKLYISWIGPRGIVAAGIASLFGITLTQQGVPGAEYITPLVFMIVLGTVILNATTARFFARLLGVILKTSDGVMIVGANKAARIIGKYLMDNGRHVVLVDSNPNSIEKARTAGLEAFTANIYSDDLSEHFELLDMGYLLAMTSSTAVNQFACRRFHDQFGENGTFRLATAEDLGADGKVVPADGLFSWLDDYLNLNEVARDFPEMQHTPVRDQQAFLAKLEQIKDSRSAIPLFLKQNGNLEIIPSDVSTLEIQEGNQIVYMGRPVEVIEEVES